MVEVLLEEDIDDGVKGLNDESGCGRLDDRLELADSDILESSSDKTFPTAEEDNGRGDEVGMTVFENNERWIEADANELGTVFMVDEDALRGVTCAFSFE